MGACLTSVPETVQSESRTGVTEDLGSQHRATVSGMRQVFRKQPENGTSVEGEGTIIECEVEALSGQVQWVRDGLLLGPGRTLPGFPRYSVTGNSLAGVFNLQIDNVQLGDDASYQCQVGQSELSPGIISRTAWLDVLSEYLIADLLLVKTVSYSAAVPPKIPIIQEVFIGTAPTWVAGEEYSLTCHVKDSKPAASIVFTKGGLELSRSETTVIPGSKPKLFSTVSVIRVTPGSSDHGKDLICAAWNPALSQPRTTAFRMNILYPPEMPKIEGLSQSQVKAGVALQLVCTSTGGNPLAMLQWLKGDVVLSKNWETDEATRSSRSLLTYMTKPQDDGMKLMCEALNQVTANPLRAVIILHVVYAPTRVTIFGKSRAAEGEVISLSCSTSSSNPPAHIRWWAAGKELNVTEVTYSRTSLGVSTISNVTVTTSRQDNGMIIVCEAVNEAVFMTRSASIVLKVNYPPERIWILGPPQSVRFQTGAQVTLSCFVSGGNPPARLTWKKGSKPVPRGVYKSTGKLASSELTITTVPSDNQVNYKCSAIAPIDMKMTSSVETVHQGETITLTCHIGSSNPVPQVAWIKDGVRLPAADVKIRDSDYGGQSVTAEMSLVAMSSDHGKRVLCEAYSPVLEEALNTFHQLDILHAPEFSPDQVGIVQAEEQGAVVIPIQITANPPEVTYTWSRNGQLLVKDGPTRHHLKADGSLEIWNLTRNDAGIYRIHLRNEEGENEMLIKLEVKYSPRISGITDPAEVDLGGSVELVCTADANPVTSHMVIWRWIGEGRKVTESDQVYLDSTTKLIIEAATQSDAGSYECLADNGIAPVTTARAQLIVRFKPKLQKGVHLSKEAVAGDGSSTATLICKAEGIPDVEFYWAKNGVALDPNNPRYLQTTLHEGPLHTGQLNIINASASLDYATFTCTAQNPLGLDTFDIHLVSTGRPDPPTGLALLRKTHNSVTLSWAAGFNGGLEQTFQIRYISERSLSYLYADVYPAQASSFTLTGLRPLTVYNVSVRAVNALGSSDYADSGIALSVTTSDTGVWDPFPTKARFIPEQIPGGFLIPLPLLIPLLILALLLLFGNIGIIVGLIHRVRQRGTGKDTEKSASLQRKELNDYTDELVNVTSRRTMLIETESELCSTTYESYDASTSHCEQAPDHRHRLRLADNLIPRMLPPQEPAHWAGRDIPNEAGYAMSVAQGIYPHVPQEVGLRDQEIYEDVNEQPDWWPRHPAGYLTSNQPRRASGPGMMVTGGFPGSAGAVYDDVCEAWGELV
ncbi:nephrin [Cetorhinus maximus]